ncbi:MAG: NAD(P)H-dependent oxidoreductase [Gammaproteobacteria bacterium]|jgi:NAD(P)H-dependent FMN reductase
MGLRIVVFYGSVRTVRTARQGIKAARFIVNQCRKRGHDVDLIDPREYPLPLVDKMCKEYEPEAVPAVLQRLAAIIKSADAYIIVSGEYNHTIPPALSNLLDYFLEEYFRKPSAIVCSQGAFGGVRAAMTLRVMLAELGMSSIPSLFPVPRVQSAFDDEGRPFDDAWYARAEKFFAELEWYGNAMKWARDKSCERSDCDTLNIQ